MILTVSELAVVKPALALIDHLANHNVVVQFIAPGGRCVTLDLSAAGILVKATYPDSSPAVEHFRNPMGLAQAYRIPARWIGIDADAD